MLKGVATLEEIRRSWSIDDVMNYNEIFDLEDEAALRVAEQRAAEMKGRPNG